MEALQVGGRAVPLLLVQNSRARRYLLRLRPDGTVRVTIPRRGTASAARDFAARNVGWLEQQLQRLAAQPKAPVVWALGTQILFRGESVCLEPESAGVVRFGTERVKVPVATADLRPAIQKHLRQRAARELPVRLAELAARHGWEELGRRIDIKCFQVDPSIKSSLKFLRKTPWARKKVEDLYLQGKT